MMETNSLLSTGVELKRQILELSKRVFGGELSQNGGFVGSF